MSFYGSQDNNDIVILLIKVRSKLSAHAQNPRTPLSELERKKNYGFPNSLEASHTGFFTHLVFFAARACLFYVA